MNFSGTCAKYCVKVEPEQKHNISAKINWSGWIRGVEDSALGLRQKVPCNRNFKVLFDNWFLTLLLSVESMNGNFCYSNLMIKSLNWMPFDE